MSSSESDSPPKVSASVRSCSDEGRRRVDDCEEDREWNEGGGEDGTECWGLYVGDMGVGCEGVLSTSRVETWLVSWLQK